MGKACQVSGPPWKFAACLLFPDAGLFNCLGHATESDTAAWASLLHFSAWNSCLSQHCTTAPLLPLLSPAPKPCQPLPGCALEETPLHLERPAGICGSRRKNCGRLFWALQSLPPPQAVLLHPGIDVAPDATSRASRRRHPNRLTVRCLDGAAMATLYEETKPDLNGSGQALQLHLPWLRQCISPKHLTARL